MSFLEKVKRVLGEASSQRRSHGNRAALRLVMRHVYSRSTMVLFESRDQRLVLPLGAEFEVARVDAARRADFETAISEAGAGSDVTNFDRGAAAWVVLTKGQGVAVGWRFLSSPLFAPLGYDPARTIYLGGYHVREEFRGRGLYPHLVQRMFAESADATCAIAETALDNVSSQRGLSKAGFQRLGLVQRLTVGGTLVRCRLVREAA